MYSRWCFSLIKTNNIYIDAFFFVMSSNTSSITNMKKRTGPKKSFNKFVCQLGYDVYRFQKFRYYSYFSQRKISDDIVIFFHVKTIFFNLFYVSIDAIPYKKYNINMPYLEDRGNMMQ